MTDNQRQTFWRGRSVLSQSDDTRRNARDGTIPSQRSPAGPSETRPGACRTPKERGDPGWVGRRVQDGRERRLGRSQGGGGPRAEQARQPALRARGASPREGGTAMPRTRRPRRRAAPRAESSIRRSSAHDDPPNPFVDHGQHVRRGPASRAPCRCARAALPTPLHVDRLRPATRKSPADAPPPLTPVPLVPPRRPSATPRVISSSRATDKPSS